MIEAARQTPCPASEVPIHERTPEQIADAGIKASLSSEDCVAFLISAYQTVPLIKPVVKMYVSQYLRRNRRENTGGNQ
jgi:hypothetical protein